MHLIDIFSVIVLAVLAVKGFSKGLVLEIASLAALFIGAVAGLKLMHYTSAYLSAEMGWNGKWLLVFAFFLIFALVVISVNVIAKVIEKVLKLAALGFFNRLGGAAFGVIKGAFLLSLIFWVLQKSELVSESVFLKSQVAKHILGMAPTVFNVFANVVPLVGDLLDDLGEVFENFASEKEV